MKPSTPPISAAREALAAACRAEPAPGGRDDGVLHPFAGELPVVLVPDLDDAGPAHWQASWHQLHRDFVRVLAFESATPDLDRWATRVRNVIRSTSVPPLVVGHGFGCLALLRTAHRDRLRLAGAMLVAPADPWRFDAMRWLPHDHLPYPALIVASTNDPALRFARAATLAQRWGARLVRYPDAGHLGADAGLGAWPAGIGLLRALAERCAAAGSIGREPRRARRGAAPRSEPHDLTMR